MRAAWQDTQRQQAFETIAAVVLPDHMHFIWRLPTDDDDFSTRIGLIKAGFTRRLSPALKGEGRKRERNIWQRRFWEHVIRDDEDLNRHVDYIHCNPVKHGYVPDPDDWPFSTWKRWKKDYERPVTMPPEDWRASRFGET